MIKIKKKFILNKESLQKLSDVDLSKAVGAGSDFSNQCCPPPPPVV